MTEGSQEFCLRWNNHQATIISVFDYLLENETLVDCTLAAEGQYLKAHKVVLCACSPYLELLLSQHNDKHPILIFKDIKYNELKCMIEYMYKGEVNIAQDQLNHFLKAAESLQIKGLSESEDETAPQTAVPAPRPPPPRAPPVQRIQPRPISSSLAVESPKRINRNEAASPTRKRRRLPQGRPSLSGDDASNASESHLDQSNCDVPSNVQPSNDNAVAKLETNSELMLEPKTEYDDNSVEDITLDDDDEEYSQAGTSMDNSQMNFSGWQGMDKSGGDEVFSGQDSGAQNSQEIACLRCEETLPRTTETLVWHSQVCSEGLEDRYTCCMCVYDTKNWSNITNHVRHHLGDKPFHCSYCPYSSTQAGNLRTHHQKKHCDEEMAPIKDPLSRIHVIPMKHGGTDVILMNLKDSPETCRFCSVELQILSVENIISHILGCSSLGPYNEQKKFSCCICSYESDSMINLTDHVKGHVLQQSRLAKNFLSKKRSYSRTTRPPILVSEDFVECRFCSSTLPACTETLISHKKECVMKIVFAKLHVCFICDYESDVRNDMRNHIRAHLGEKPFKCPYCPYSMTQMQNLKKHVKAAHPDEYESFK